MLSWNSILCLVFEVVARSQGHERQLVYAKQADTHRNTLSECPKAPARIATKACNCPNPPDVRLGSRARQTLAIGPPGAGHDRPDVPDSPPTAVMQIRGESLAAASKERRALTRTEFYCITRAIASSMAALIVTTSSGKQGATIRLGTR
jgi:hypothetical protein